MIDNLLLTKVKNRVHLVSHLMQVSVKSRVKPPRFCN